MRRMFSSRPAAAAARKYLIGGNWKCNGTTAQVQDLVQMLNDAGKLHPNTEVVVSPPMLHIPYVKKNLRQDIAVAAQNVGKDAGFGAFTGEVSADMIADFGIPWVITGHSERRAGFGGQGESSALVAEKTKVAIAKGLSVMACVGEKLADRESGRTLDIVLKDQLAPIVDALSLDDWSNVVVAYEPVWAIGTGVTATPEQAEEVHAAIRQWVDEQLGHDVAEALRIIYGGSVKGSNAPELAAKPNIDGFLVGGAALKPDFLAIIDACTPEQAK